MTAIEQSHRQWLEQGALLASEKKFIQSEAAARSCAPAHEPMVILRSYDTRRLGYSLSAHPAAQFDRAKTSGGSPPLQHRDVLRSSGSMFFCMDSDGSGLPHAEAKASIPPPPPPPCTRTHSSPHPQLASFKKKYQELSLERAFPDKYAVRETAIQERVKTALKDIVKVEELKRSGQRDEHVELVQVCCHATGAAACSSTDTQASEHTCDIMRTTTRHDGGNSNSHLPSPFLLFSPE